MFVIFSSHKFNTKKPGKKYPIPLIINLISQITIIQHVKNWKE